jgi:hypothetical protein
MRFKVYYDFDRHNALEFTGCFAVEYSGEKVLSGRSRDLAGLFFVLVCVFCTIWSLGLMRQNFSRK